MVSESIAVLGPVVRLLQSSRTTQRRAELMDVASFSQIEKEFMDRVARIVWCTMTTIDRKSRPRARIIHPIWQGTTGWIATGRHSHKA